MSDRKTADQIWKEFWLPMFEEMAWDQLDDSERWDLIKRELADYRDLLEAVPKILMAATGGQCSKPNTDPDVVCGLIEEEMQEQYNRGYQDGLEDGGANP